MFSGLDLFRKACKIYIEKTWKFNQNFIKNLKHTPKMHNKLLENHPIVNFKACKGQEKQKWAKKWSKRRRFAPKVDPKGGTIHFTLRTIHRAGAVGKGRVGVNPYPGTGIGVCSWGSTRSEAKGLGGLKVKSQGKRNSKISVNFRNHPNKKEL